MLRSEDRQAMIEEYRVLFDAVWERGRATWLVNSVLIPSSILIVLQAMIHSDNLWNAVAGLFSVLSFVLVFYCLLFHILTNKVNKECWIRINQIEEILRIQGNRLIYSKIRNKWWYYLIRSKMWYVFLLLLVITDLIVSFSLFLEFLWKIESHFREIYARAELLDFQC